MKVRDIMTNQITSAHEGTPINEVARTMKEMNIGAMPVCNANNQPVGIVTDRDLVVRGIVSGMGGNESVNKVMSSHLIYATPDMHVHEAARIMGERQIRRLPVVENGQVVGMVSIGDLAVRNIYENEAGKALSDISTPSRPMQ